MVHVVVEIVLVAPHPVLTVVFVKDNDQSGKMAIVNLWEKILEI